MALKAAFSHPTNTYGKRPVTEAQPTCPRALKLMYLDLTVHRQGSSMLLPGFLLLVPLTPPSDVTEMD